MPSLASTHPSIFSAQLSPKVARQRPADLTALLGPQIEVHRIRQDEKAKARAELDRVLAEQQHLQAKQQNALRKR